VSDFGWATVHTVNPLTVRRDGETEPLGVEPDALVDKAALQRDSRVWCQFHQRRVLILGVSGGLSAMVEEGNLSDIIASINTDDFSLRSGDYVKIGGLFLALRGGVTCKTGLDEGNIGNTNVIQLKAGYRPSVAGQNFLGPYNAGPIVSYGVQGSGWVTATATANSVNKGQDISFAGLIAIQNA
jgi:hypothetical protein